MEDKKAPRLEIIVSRKKQLIVGFLLIGAGLVMPLFVNQNLFPVMKYFRLAMHEDDYMLIISALLLTIMNIFRAIPHYIGAYWVADALTIRYKGNELKNISGFLIVLLLLLTYYLIDVIHDIHYDFGLPAIIMTAILVLYDYLHYNYVSLTKRTLFLMVSLMSLQFLDIMPAAGGLPVGRGELSRDIKRAAEVLFLEEELDIVALVGLGALLLFALLLFFMLRDENALRQMAQLREDNEQMRMEVFEREVQNRTLKETQYLVHDLKSPLSVVNTLEGVLRIQSSMGQPQEEETFVRMERALDQMSTRISQLLTLEQRDNFTIDDLFHDVMAQISIESFAQYVSADTPIPQAQLYANQVLLSRALVNLVRNAAQAIPEDREPRIELTALRQDGCIVLKVTDNGRGVNLDKQEAIWSHGFSGKGSSGLGLAFVKQAAENAGGRVDMKSQPGKETAFEIWIPEEAQDD